MRVPVPCPLGQTQITSRGIYELNHISWFQWRDGLEVSYFYKVPNKWHPNHFEVIKNPRYEEYYDIHENLLRNDFLKEKGYPLKGRGYVVGLKKEEEMMYADIILYDKYLAHIYVPCDENGKYVEGGTIFVPPSWDTEEKKKAILLSQYRNHPVISRF